MRGLNECVLDFLEVIEFEAYANINYCINSIVRVAFVALFAIKLDATLVILGLVMLVVNGEDRTFLQDAFVFHSLTVMCLSAPRFSSTLLLS